MILLVLIFVLISLFFPHQTFAQSYPRYTLIINQVRGEECCDKGNVDNVVKQLGAVGNLQLTANFALRYDALVDSKYTDLFDRKNANLVGGLLEITPKLAEKAKVKYKGDADTWYEAQNIFLVGYSQDERKKLIDAYMSEFYKKFEMYPKFTTAWMVDAWSLKYLKQQYGVALAQITREQFGTDSYTLWGGPVHYPYRPSEKWALVPDTGNLLMPIIVRQTIADPVFSYGDTSNSYTSQPNDYLTRGVDINYFKHLFSQAHSQKGEYTFALLGLENSMDEKAQNEYLEQLKFIKDWLAEDEANSVVAAADFANFFKLQKNKMWVYGGKSAKDSSEQALWITTNYYRARVRLSAGNLFISDLRLYDKNFEDPYLNKSAGLLGWWIVPFVLDGSRYFVDQDSNIIQNLRNDYLKSRETRYSVPTMITIAEGVDPNDFKVENGNGLVTLSINNKVVARFEQEKFSLAKAELKLTNSVTNYILRNLQYFSKEGKVLWGFDSKDGNYSAFVLENSLGNERKDRSDLNFPQLENKMPDRKLSELFVNNKYAVVGRNPVRLILFPRDSEGYTALLPIKTQVKSSNALR